MTLSGRWFTHAALTVFFAFQAHAIGDPPGECAQALVLDALLKHADINSSQNTTGSFLPLHNVIFNNSKGQSSLGAVKILVNNGADYNKQTDYGDTALSLAISRREWETVRYLLGLKDIDCNTVDRRSGRSPFLEATFKWAPLDILSLLVKKGADPHFLNQKPPETALTSAIQSGDLARLKMMLENFKISLLPQDFEAATEVHFGQKIISQSGLFFRPLDPISEKLWKAAKREAKVEGAKREFEFFKFLSTFPQFSEWLHSKPVGSVGYTPLIRLLFANDTEQPLMEVVKLFIQAGADYNAVSDSDGRFGAIDFAIRSRDWDTVRYLLSLPGYDPNPVKNGEILSPLLHALEEYAPLSVVTAFMNAGANFEYWSRNKTALTAAIKAVDIKRVSTLIREFKVPVRIIDFMTASEHRYLDKASGFERWKSSGWAKPIYQLIGAQKRAQLFNELLSQSTHLRPSDFNSKEVAEMVINLLRREDTGRSVVNIIQSLIARGLDPNLVTDLGETVLGTALIYRDYMTADYLLALPSIDLSKLNIKSSYSSTGPLSVLESRNSNRDQAILNKIKWLKQQRGANSK